MATVTDSVGTAQSTAIISGAAAQIAAWDKKVAGLVGDAEKAKGQIVTALQQHVAAHQADIAKHQAEVDAATAIIAQASPGTTVKADTAAAYVLTSASWVQGGINFLGRNWRYVVGVLALGVIAYGKFVLHI